jgi:hypothetical protein
MKPAHPGFHRQLPDLGTLRRSRSRRQTFAIADACRSASDNSVGRQRLHGRNPAALHRRSSHETGRARAGRRVKGTTAGSTPVVRTEVEEDAIGAPIPGFDRVPQASVSPTLSV